MAAVARPGKIGVYVELPIELRDRFKAFCKDRGEDFAAHVRQAMERHLKYPPPVAEVEPLPVDDVASRKRGRPKKTEGKQKRRPV
jgi:predicted DNA-binding protein